MAKNFLVALPVELLYTIHLLAANSSLPLTSKHLFTTLNQAPKTVKALYLLHRYSQSAVPSSELAPLVGKALTYPVCTLDVFKRFLDLLPGECGILFSGPPKSNEDGVRLQKYPLPRRLFRNLGSSSSPATTTEDDNRFELLKFLYALPRICSFPTSTLESSSSSPLVASAQCLILYPDVNAHRGYALIKAVQSRDLPIVRYLLEKGANPEMANNLAVKLAIHQRDFDLVKLLVEGPKLKSPAGLRQKDLVKVDATLLKQAIKARAQEVVDWFLGEKGAIPDMESLRMLR